MFLLIFLSLQKEGIGTGFILITTVIFVFGNFKVKFKLIAVAWMR